jgi:tetratricopeptide (TPR) repeat protein
LAEEIARGGMGVIYRATDTVLGREVAVKVLSEKFGPDSGTARRFADEARITAQLQHPGIPPVHDLGTLPDGRPFLAMKLIKGQTLDQLLKGRADVATERGRFVAVFEQLCQALAYAHSHDVIHRDLKPANVMVGGFGEVQLMDWGLAKVLRQRPADTDDPEATTAQTQVHGHQDSHDLLTQAGSVLGTPAYMPPEQAIGAIDQIDARSDVFGLGGVLAAILTGRAPFQAETAESSRQLAARGKVEDCFARLDGCGADPELVALCKRCLSPEKTDRPAAAGAVATAVASLRAAADERARRAELDRVRVEGEKAAAEARSLERRRRRQLWLGASAALILAILAGLGAVLWVQHQANTDLEDKNQQLAAQQKEVEDRFELAQKAIGTFHTGVSEDALLKNPGLAELRKKLLQEAAGFYADLDKLLAGKTDPKSRRLLAAGYYQLADLTDKIGDKKDALAVHQKALLLRRELAALSGADVEAQLELARSLEAVGKILQATGDKAGALASFEKQRDLAGALENSSLTDAVRVALAQGHHNIGMVLSETGPPAEALAACEKALAIRQKLADANPADAKFQRDLAWSHNNIGLVLSETGRPLEALKAHDTALAIRQKLADGAPSVPDYQGELAKTYNNIGAVLMDRLHKPGEALTAFKKACDIQQRLADASPAVNQYQSDLARFHGNIGIVLTSAGGAAEALQEYEKAREIQQKLADASPAVIQFQTDLARTYNNMGTLLMNRLGKPAEALAAQKKALAIKQKLADASPNVPDLQADLARTHSNMGYVLSQTGKAAEALEAWQTALKIQEKLADTSPSVTQFQHDLAVTHHHIGVLCMTNLGKPAEALVAFQKARDIHQRLSDASPTIPGHKKQLADSYHIIGNVLVDTGRPAEALPAWEKARDILQKLADASPTVASYQSNLAATQIDLGRLHARLKQFREALAALDAGVVLWQKLADTSPMTTRWTGYLSNSHASRGWAHVRAGHPAEAAADLRRALDLWARVKAPDLDTWFERSRALALLSGLGKEAKSGVTAAEAATFSDQAVAALRDAIKAGWASPDELKETDFDSLRQRDDFQKLVKELEARAAKQHQAGQK